MVAAVGGGGDEEEDVVGGMDTDLSGCPSNLDRGMLVVGVVVAVVQIEDVLVGQDTVAVVYVGQCNVVAAAVGLESVVVVDGVVPNVDQGIVVLVKDVEDVLDGMVAVLDRGN